jgi:hypothetical protein
MKLVISAMVTIMIPGVRAGGNAAV